ncbi:MAG TPA: ABC transporter substrate-binding protein [Burkholderiales bacterium]|jgi:NitT/TauT family transport system substrate-binding protein|nr:ABC transporter substrate-binding protein [Burkholderiales bacterium]
MIKQFLRAALAGLLLAAAAVPAHAQDTKLRFTLDWRFEGPSALFLAAQAKGYFKAEHLDVTIDAGTGSGAAVTRVATGAYDLGFADISALIEFIGNNPGAQVKPQAIYMVYESTPAAVLVLKKSGIKTPADLKGKTFGAPVFDAGRKAFPIFARANKIDLSTVTWKTMEPALRETMLARGELDAITGFTFTSQIGLIARGVKNEDITVFKYNDFGAELYGNAIIASPKILAEKPEAVRGFLRAVNRAIKDVVAKPDAAIAYVKERDPLITEATELTRLKMAIEFVDTPVARSTGLGSINKLRFDNTIDRTVAAFGIKNQVSPDGIFNSSFLPSAGDRKL